MTPSRPRRAVLEDGHGAQRGCLVLLIPEGVLPVHSPAAHGRSEVATTGGAAREPAEESA